LGKLQEELQMANTVLQKRTLVVPALPPIDKYIAAKRVMLDWESVARFDVAFCDVNVPRPEDYKRWDGDNPGSAILIDLGDEKYHGRCMSAAEMAKMKSNTENGATWNKLLEMANKNNQTGYLKNAPHAVPKLIREIPHTFADRKRGEAETWGYGMEVVNSYFWRQDRRAWEALFTDPSYAKLRQLWEGFSVIGEPFDFTLPFFFRRMFRSGRTEAEIMRKMSWWLDKAKDVTHRHERAGKGVFKPRQFSFKNGGTAGLFHVADYFESGAFNYQWVGSGKLALGILRNRFGGIVILSSGRHQINLERVYQELARREPTRWYFEGRFSSGHMVMNQSWQFIGVTPTSLSDDELIAIVAEHAVYQGRKARS
jgi:hypothetical protein